MRDCDIKLVNQEITPFGGLSLFLKMLEKCHFEEHIMQSGVPLQESNRGYKPIQLILGLFAGVWCQLLWPSWRCALWHRAMWPAWVETWRGPSCIPAISQQILPSCQPACFRKFIPLVLLRVEVRQLHLGLRFNGNGPWGKSGRSGQRIQPQTSRTALASSSTCFRFRCEDDSKLLATPRQYIRKHQLSVISWGHTVKAGRQTRRTGPHGQWLLCKGDTWLSGRQGVTLYHSLPFQ